MGRLRKNQISKRKRDEEKVIYILDIIYHSLCLRPGTVLDFEIYFF